MAGSASGGLSFSLGAAPTAGNLLVAICAQNATNVTINTGWTQLYLAGVSSYNRPSVFYKFANAGESTTQTPFTSSYGAGALWEIGNLPCANNQLVNPVFIHDVASATAGSSGTAAFSNSIILAMANNEQNTNAITFGSGTNIGNTASWSGSGGGAAIGGSYTTTASGQAATFTLTATVTAAALCSGTVVLSAIP
jgi:hypothetical protein